MTAEIPEGIYASDDALKLHRDVIVFDCLGGNYLLESPYYERALEGGVTASTLTMASEGRTWDQVLDRIETAHRKIEANPDIVLALRAEDIRQAKRDGKLAIILGTQGSDVIGTNLNRVGILYRLGIRYIGLAYTGATLFGDGCGESRNAGLSYLGKDFVAAVNDFSMPLDLSHTGHQSRFEAAQLARYPVCTHSNAYTVNPNDRNTKDETSAVIAGKGGVMGVTGLVRAVAPQNPTIEDMLDHARYFVEKLGARHTGIGLDFIEAEQEEYQAGHSTGKAPKWRQIRPDIFGTVEDFYTEKYPTGLQSIRLLPNFTHGLLERGCDELTVREIMGEAWLRNFELAFG